jgi:uncharacterized protein (DUF983 family)
MQTTLTPPQRTTAQPQPQPAVRAPPRTSAERRQAAAATVAARAGKRPGFLGLLGRGIVLHCPRCGQGDIRQGWFKLKNRCPNCELALERGESEDYWLGAYAINLVAAEFVALLMVVGLILATLPAVPWGTVVWLGLAGALLTPILFFPFSRTLWLALDLYARPTENGDRATRLPYTLPDDRPRV